MSSARPEQPQPARSDLAPGTLPASSSPPPAGSSTTRATPGPALAELDEDATPPSGWSVEQIRAHMARPITSGTLYKEHWPFVFQLLPGYGVWGSDQEDVAQTIWQQIHAQIGTYDPERQSPRAWITGFVRRCAANYRRTLERRPESPAADPGATVAASGLNPEQYALLKTIEQAVPDEEQREAFVLRHQHGMTLEEIAAAMELSEGQVEWKLQQARELLWTWER